MRHDPLISEAILHQNADFAESQGIIPKLIYKLVTASIQNPKELRIPTVVNQPGWDGIIDSPQAFRQFVPIGKSFWEVGTGNNPIKKASADFKKRLSNITLEERSESTYVFVTARSATRSGGWNIDSQRKWINRRINTSGWKDIKIIDATQVEHWLELFPEIDLWLAEKFNIIKCGLESPALYWKKLSNYGYPPSLKPEVFLEGRQKLIEEVLKILHDEIFELKIETLFPEEAIDFIVALLETLPEIEQATYSGRCLIINDSDTWSRMCSLNIPHILIAMPNLDLNGTGAILRNEANKYHKSVIYSTTPTEYVHENSHKLTEMKSHQLYKNLLICGYKEERARQISERCKGKITTLKRILMDLQASPYWIRSDFASELAIVSLIGQWDGNKKGDIEAIENILGKAYGEWLSKIHPLTFASDPPLIQQNEKWHFISRYEGWQNLGKFILDKDLDRFSEISIIIFTEIDPKFDLSSDERWLASTKNKNAKYSEYLKKGLAETLALLGTYPNALSSTSVNKAESIVNKTIRAIFINATWRQVATLNDYLPLFAEADPKLFLDILEELLTANNKIFFNLFAQEGGPIAGWNYMTGILWGLEILAWDGRYITSVCRILGDLSVIDPGGNWSNRPFNSLINIFLPWRLQTSANVEKRRIALNNLVKYNLPIAWELLLKLLPHSQMATTDNCKPTWRTLIAEDFSQIVSTNKYLEISNLYSDLALDIAKKDLNKLLQLVEHLDDIFEPSFSKILNYLKSSEFVNQPKEELYSFWECITKIIRKHRKYPEAEWAFPDEIIAQIEEIQKQLEPNDILFKYKYLFNEKDHDLVEDEGNYEEQRKVIEKKRTEAVSKIYFQQGKLSILQFTQQVKYPLEVGSALGRNSRINIDNALLPKYLICEEKYLSELARGYAWSKFYCNRYKWFDKLNCSKWDTAQKVEILTLLPFVSDTWERVEQLLANEEFIYWENTNASPYHLKSKDFNKAIEYLIKYDRPNAAINILQWMLHIKEQPSIKYVYLALLADNNKEEKYTPIDGYAIIELIKWLQHNESINNGVLENIEWKYLNFLDHHLGASPKTLYIHLATDPYFFCEVIKTIFRSEKHEDEKTIIDENKSKIAEHAYRLISNWKTIPGQQNDGSINEKVMNEWLKTIKQSCTESGHLTVALSIIGKVFAHSSEDPHGLWINKVIAEELDLRENNVMRDGFITELYNMQGVYYVSSGESENTISKSFEIKAEQIENEGYSRLSESLYELARMCHLDAKHAASCDPLDN